MTVDKTSEIKQTLLDEIRSFEIIDCHEHLGPERQRTQQSADVLNLFSHYTRTDLITAGMAEENYEKLLDHDYPVEYRWELLKPWLQQVRHGAYARAAFITAREFYGFDDINDSNYRQLSAAIQDSNEPGLYNRVLRDTCNIRHALTQCGSTETESELLIPLMPADNYCTVNNWRQVQSRASAVGHSVSSLDDYVAVMNAGMAEWKRQGAVGIKSRCRPYPDGERADAVDAFQKLRSGTVQQLPDLHPLNTYLMQKLFDHAADNELVVAVHAGMWDDFTKLDVKHMIPYFTTHPQTTFDLYHLSFPSVHDAVIVGKNFGNVYLNLCWTHIMSPTLTMEGMQELLDFVPVNRIFAFGGDYHSRAVEKTIGHLRMAQNNIATVLAERVADNLMTDEQAVTVARKWFWDNPVHAYNLDV